MKNRFYTFMVIPERTSDLRKWVAPAWLVKSSGIGLVLLMSLGLMMMLDYWYVMGQIHENRDLKIENRRLRQQVQIYKNRVTSIEGTLERIETFETRLRVITNIEDRDDVSQLLGTELPDAANNIGTKRGGDSADLLTRVTKALPPELEEAGYLAVADPERLLLERTYEELDKKCNTLNLKSLDVEQGLQDLYELLADQKLFLAALPTVKPSTGTFTSGFGIRPAPLGGGDKMHEGLDIANWPGTPIKSTAYGTVKFSGIKPGYGKTVIVDHGFGLETWYAHVRTLGVKTGDTIRRGQQIATMGSSGHSTGPHVHYEVRVRSIPVDPLTYILQE